MKILHLDSSALGARSVSRELSQAIVAAWRRLRPDATVSYRDLAANPLPHWTPVADAADPAARLASEVLDEFLAADVVVIGAPMYNFSIPSTLKAWIDRIAVAGKTFRYTATGPEGLAGDKRVIVASARGGYYGAGTPGAAADYQEAYLRQVFGFLGIDQVTFVRAEGVNIGPEQREQALAAAHATIAEREARLAA
ncbi:MAG: FMN-dependent NADH-azoreductase [Rhodanobacteraceae bacterium]|nr:FMN-dependent NADH-azoreductase [Rhodanobacteraceae bacterium]